jgi:hypothetical protein
MRHNIGAKKLMTSGIYCITNTLTNKRYVGRSKNIEQRVKNHGVGRYSQKHLTYEVLQECSVAELGELEWDWAYRLKPELNRTTPILHPVRGKIWRNPNVVSRIKQRGETK